MLRFDRFEGPRGIPVYYQQLPEVIKSSSVALVVFVGGADDSTVGEPGIYHWFEHIPFRGTKKFPNSYSDTFETISKTGGNLNASTGLYRTSYHSTFPTRSISTALDVVIDLVANPLLTEDGIFAERKIIHQEIGNKLGSIDGILGYKFNNLLWPNHNIGHHVLGSVESLDSMTPETLRKAREKGYDISRMSFFISTSLSLEQVMTLIQNRFDELPESGLSERRKNNSYGQLVWPEEKRFSIETDFNSSIFTMIYQNPPYNNWSEMALASMLASAFSHGGPGSPLNKVVREDSHLAYSSNIERMNSLDGGYFGFEVKTSTKNLPIVEEVLMNMVKNNTQLRSAEWINSIRSSRRNNLDMEIINPSSRVNGAVGEVGILGKTIETEEFLDLIDNISNDEILHEIDKLAREEPYVITIKGK